MKLPHSERAVVNVTKLRDYSLNPAHEVGKHKARVFRAALGLTAENAEWLRERILQAAIEADASPQPSSPFGENYVVDFLIEHGGGRAMVRTSWIIEYGTDFPRLTSCYVI
ncbi:MAG TPA: hypothetical protein VGV59_08160 [Pyrinomonadaceae bacterium]|nr:hypothetical protein [Pyrinomonadaceae bacterium]